MKKRCFLPAIACLLAGSLYAQDFARAGREERPPLLTAPDDSYPQSGFHAGARFQPQINWIRSNAFNRNSVSVSTSLGYGYALSLAYFFSNHFDMQLELMYSSLEQRFTNEYKTSGSINLNYLHVPLLLSYNTNYGKPLNFSLGLGPQIGLLTGSSITGNESDPAKRRAVLSVKPMDLGLAYDAGFDLALGSKKHVHLSLGIRGVSGLVPIENVNGTLVTNEYYILDKARITTLGSYIGLMIKL
jgi:hypothetical protein